MTIELPDASQCRRLVEAVCRTHARLAPRYSMWWHLEEERELYDGFATSVRYIATLGRTSTPDHRHHLSYWVDACQDWARLNNIAPVGNVGRSFFLAAIAMRVPYQLGNHAMGNLPAVGLPTTRRRADDGCRVEANASGQCAGADNAGAAVCVMVRCRSRGFIG